MTKKDNFDDIIGKHFEFPTALLHQIAECANEGFLLFFIDDQLEPQARAQFPHRITEMGLRAYATKFLQEINSLEEKSIAENLVQESDEEDNSEE